MLGKEFQLTPLEARRQMLLKESELNRIQFLNEWNEWKGEVRRLAEPLQAAGAFISIAAGTGAAVSILRRIFGRRNGAAGGKSWISSLFGGVKAGISIWKMFRSRGRQS